MKSAIKMRDIVHLILSKTTHPMKSTYIIKDMITEIRRGNVWEGLQWSSWC